VGARSYQKTVCLIKFKPFTVALKDAINSAGADPGSLGQDLDSLAALQVILALEVSLHDCQNFTGHDPWLSAHW